MNKVIRQSDSELLDFMLHRHAKIVKKTKKISGLPLTFISSGKPLKDLIIYGNTEAISGTSVSVGNKTKNLFDGNLYKGTIISDDSVEGNSTEAQQTRCRSNYISIEPDCDYTISVSNNPNGWILVYDQNFNKVYRYPSAQGDITYPTGRFPMTIHTPSSGCYLRFVIASNINNVSNVQLEKGGTSTDFEPYGYKIPVKISGKNLFNKTSPDIVYLAMNGGTFASADRTNIVIPVIGGKTYTITKPLTDVYQTVFSITHPADQVSYRINNENTFINHDSGNMTVTRTAPAEAKYLTIKLYNQYKAPETISSILEQIQVEENTAATPYEQYHEPITTDIYVAEQIPTGETISAKEKETVIPTFKGTNIITVETTVLPSQIELTGHIKNSNS